MFFFLLFSLILYNFKFYKAILKKCLKEGISITTSKIKEMTKANNVSQMQGKHVKRAGLSFIIGQQQ